jgi:heme exporter protein B
VQVQRSVSLGKEIRSVVAREWQIELRQRYALNGLSLYVVATVLVVAVGLRASRTHVEPGLWAVLFWVLLLFTALTAVAKSFVAEPEGQQLMLYPWVSPTALIAGRLVYNSLLLTGLSMLASLVYGSLLGLPGSLLSLVPILLLGAVALSGVLTLTSALAAKARNATTLMAVLSLPLVVPQLLTLVRVTLAWAGAAVNVSSSDWLALIGLAVLPTLVSLLLYPYLWREA